MYMQPFTPSHLPSLPGPPGAPGSTTLTGLTDVDILTPIAGQTLKFDGSKWVNGSVPELVLGASQFGVFNGESITKTFNMLDGEFVLHDWLTFDIWLYLFNTGDNRIVFNIPEISWTYNLPLPNLYGVPIRCTLQYLDQAFIGQMISNDNLLLSDLSLPSRSPLGFTFNTTFQQISGGANAGIGVEMFNVTKYQPT